MTKRNEYAKFAFFCCDKYHDHKQLGAEGVWLKLPDSVPSLREVWAGIQGRDWWRKLLPGLHPSLLSWLSLPPRTTCPGWHRPQWPRPSHISPYWRNPSTGLLPGESYLGRRFLSWGFLCTRGSSLCQANKQLTSTEREHWNGVVWGNKENDLDLRCVNGRWSPKQHFCWRFDGLVCLCLFHSWPCCSELRLPQS